VHAGGLEPGQAEEVALQVAVERPARDPRSSRQRAGQSDASGAIDPRSNRKAVRPRDTARSAGFGSSRGTPLRVHDFADKAYRRERVTKQHTAPTMDI
jgi:hypothetical protein